MLIKDSHENTELIKMIILISILRYMIIGISKSLCQNPLCNPCCSQDCSPDISRAYQVYRKWSVGGRASNRKRNCCHWKCTLFRTTRCRPHWMFSPTTVWLMPTIPRVLWTLPTLTGPACGFWYMTWRKAKVGSMGAGPWLCRIPVTRVNLPGPFWSHEKVSK